ncbi:MAG: VCBS repeat-containing protein [Acidobacteriaceae bacterium]|nr:VCBS repeat-containing protein [Acidobacteriaceae bacterium]
MPTAAVLRCPPAFAEEVIAHKAPYLALEKYILPGNDEFPEEKTAFEIERALQEALRTGNLPVAADVKGVSPEAASFTSIAPDVESAVCNSGNHDVVGGWQRWVRSLGTLRRAEFYSLPGGVIRYAVASQRDGKLLYRTGFWTQKWRNGKIVEFVPKEEYIASATAPLFRDVTAAAFEHVPAFRKQLAKGVPYWRSRLDPASGIDVYGSNGIAVGDVDGDGEDEIYVCQPGGLPNRLFKFADDGTLRDVTEQWNVALLDDTSSALFIDARNSGRQDLIVLRSSGPLLFVNEGSTFRLRTDAFEFSSAPAGGFTGMAAADFDRDGKLDLYLCCYVYFLSEAQYTYAVPYQDARNGPPNFLFRNRLNQDGSGAFVDCTAETGMNENNDRFSFAPAWCDFNGDGWPDLFVANDFGRKNLYVNHQGRFSDSAESAGVVDIGPGMSASWFDYDGDGKPDLYVANMWTAAGQRVIASDKFEPAKEADAGSAYRAHTMGNSLYRNRGDGTFENTSREQNVQFGRWAWASGGHDFDNDGVPEIFVTCGMLTNESDTDLGSFFWRQVVAKSPVKAQHSEAYENGWNAINQFLREDYSWNGHEPNVLHVKRGDRYFDFSGVSGLDFAEDGRAFAVVDFDGDGRSDILLKSRLGPQVRVFQNNCAGDRHSIAFELVGTKSNRDAIGARVEVDKRTKWLDAGSGFLSQHSKRMLFGLGASDVAKVVRVTWPSGATQQFENLRAGFVYRLVEGSNECKPRPFRAARRLRSVRVEADNQLRLEDTWFEEPIPLPEKRKGPGLFTLTAAELAKDPQCREQYEIFRRYLFDWRTELIPPLSLLLNGDGHAVKIYAKIPAAERVQKDLAMLSGGKTSAPTFSGFYVNRPHRDFFKFGAAYLWAGFPDQALPYLERVLERSPNNARVQTVVGQMYLDDERLKEAEQAFRQSLAVNKDNAEALNGLGLTLAKQGRAAEAKEDFEQAIALRRDYSEAINNLGVLYVKHGKVNDAIAAFTYGIKVAPNEDILYLNLGRMYAQAGNLDRARQVMQQLLDRKPDSATARHALAELNSR